MAQTAQVAKMMKMAKMPKKDSRDRYYAAWPTAWGPMGAVAGEGGMRRIILPHYRMEDLRELLGWEHPGAEADESPFELLIELSREYFNARTVDFGEIVCDMPAAGSFSGEVYRACREIPHGRTMSYSQLARQIRRDDAARAVATAMSKNPIPLVVPCHRIVYADGRAGGFSAAGGVALKQRMLDKEARAAS